MSRTYVIEPEARNVVNEPIGRCDEVHRHDEGDALAERRPIRIAPRRLFNTPLALASHLPVNFQRKLAMV